MVRLATVIKTGETIKVYQLQNGNYYDYEGMSEAKPPTATGAGKKEFEKKELKF